MLNDANYDQAVGRCRALFDEANSLGMKEPTAVTLATSDRQGRPSARTVLIRGFDERGFDFFTNSQSRKGQQIADNPHVALCFYWELMGQQLCVEGAVHEIATEENDQYWSSRPRESQLGAWASDQSKTLPDRETLLSRVAHFTSQFAEQAVPRPEHWHGFRVVPHRIEFWQSRTARLHERTVYEKGKESWSRRWLFP